MNLIDMHCDTISALMSLPSDQNLSNNGLSINMEGMKKAGTMVQFFACFVYAASYEPSSYMEQFEDNRMVNIRSGAWNQAYKDVLKMTERIDKEQNPNLKTVHCYEEILENKKSQIISAVKTVEEGGILNGDIHRLDTLYNAGVRLMTLTWNFPNCIGYPNNRKKELMDRGLNTFGFEVIERMNELGMMIDVSHLSDGGFWDCVKTSKSPICASHSNARTLCSHPRNLSDEMLKALGDKGGVAGINFYPEFLREGQDVILEDIARHAQHMINIGGEDLVAIGTDFDGFDNESYREWISQALQMELIWEVMLKRGITPRQIDKIMSGNVLRYIREVENTSVIQNIVSSCK